jgi:hypothetical protein
MYRVPGLEPALQVGVHIPIGFKLSGLWSAALDAARQQVDAALTHEREALVAQRFELQDARQDHERRAHTVCAGCEGLQQALLDAKADSIGFLHYIGPWEGRIQSWIVRFLAPSQTSRPGSFH